MEPKTIFVTGGSGNQGYAVAKCLLEQGLRVKVLTRNGSLPKIKHLLNLGAEIVEGNLNTVESYRDSLNNVDAVFCVLTYQYGVAKEIKQGLLLADTAKMNQVKHFVYSSVIGCDLNTGIPNWESKYKIENHIKGLALPYTIIRPASLFENFLIPQVKKRIVKGTLSTPVKGNVVQQFISAHDIGKIAAICITQPDRYIGKTITIAAEQMDMNEVASTFGEVMGRKMKYQHLPMFLTRIFMGNDHAKMFNWINQHDAVFVKDLAAFKKEYPNLTGLKDWVKMNFLS